jgi:hypothetical protein
MTSELHPNLFGDSGIRQCGTEIALSVVLVERNVTGV